MDLIKTLVQLSPSTRKEIMQQAKREDRFDKLQLSIRDGLNRKRYHHHDDDEGERPSSKRICLGFRLGGDDAELVNDAVSFKPPRLESNGKRFDDDDRDLDPSCSSSATESDSDGGLKRREEVEKECKSDAVLVGSMFESIEQSTRQRIGSTTSEMMMTLNNTVSDSRRGKEKVECADDAVSTEIRLGSSQQSKRQRVGDEGFASDVVFYKPWLDSVSDDDDERIQEDIQAALILLQLSRRKTQSKTKTQVVTQPQTQLVIHTETPTQPPQPEPKSDSYKCSVCEKEFSSYQALGGHKASHRLYATGENANAEAGDKTRPKTTMAPTGRKHKCSICQAEFLTGQALGGHKRKHYEGTLGGNKRSDKELIPDSTDKSSLSNESDVTVASHGKHGLPEWIDLNEHPLPENGINRGCSSSGGRNAEEIKTTIVTNMH